VGELIERLKSETEAARETAKAEELEG